MRATVRARIHASKFTTVNVLVMVISSGCGRIGFDARTAMIDGGDDAAVTAHGFSRLVAYGDVTCAEYEGRPYCWGANEAGQVGDGSTGPRNVPTNVPVPDLEPLRGLTIGETHGCAIIGTEAYCWGDLDGADVKPPTRVMLEGIVSIAAGKKFTCAVAGSGAYCWGVNDAGQLGDGTVAPRTMPTPLVTQDVFVAVDVGDDHGCALTASNEAICWGHNDAGTLGSGSFTPETSETPVTVQAPIVTLPRIAGWHACTVQEGDVWCWGRNTEGALGNGTVTSTPTPTVVPSLGGVRIVATGGGPTDLDATCAITSNGHVWCWGAGTGGRLGNGTTTDELVPREVTTLARPAVEIALGYAHTCAVLDDGDAWCWGRGTSGQLGDGARANSFLPVRVVRPSSGG